MTDRYNGFVVILEKDIRDDDAEPILNAIRMIKGVLSVTPYISSFESLMAESRARADLGKKIFEVIYPPKQA